MRKDKDFILLFLTIVLLFNINVTFATKNNNNLSSSEEIILENPYGSAREREKKYIDISGNLSSIYQKSHIIANKFRIEKILDFFKKIIEKIRVCFVAINRIIKNFL